MDIRNLTQNPPHRVVLVPAKTRHADRSRPAAPRGNGRRIRLGPLLLVVLLAVGFCSVKPVKAQFTCEAFYDWNPLQSTGDQSPVEIMVELRTIPGDELVDWALVTELDKAELSALIRPVSNTDSFEFGSLGNFTTTTDLSVSAYDKKDLVATFGEQTLLDFLDSNDGKFSITWTDTEENTKLQDLLIDIDLPLDICYGLEITNPPKDTVIVAGSDFKITWKKAAGWDVLREFALDTLDILFSADSGKVLTYHRIGRVASDPPEYVWTVPDTLTSTAFVRLQGAVNQGVRDTSDVFRIKPYAFTRFDQNGDYEVFDPKNHGWSFINTFGKLDPPTYADTSQFQYFGNLGTDPFSFQSYDPVFYIGAVNAMGSDFPDWPSAVRAFGTDDFYWGPAILGVYKDAAVEYWHKRISKGTPWLGSCGGMSATSMLAFAHKASFGSKFSDIGPVDEIFNLVSSGGAVPDGVRAAINELHTHQWGVTWRGYYNVRRTFTPRQTLADLKRELLDVDGMNDAIGNLYISNSGIPSRAHAVVPVRLVRKSKTPNQWDLMIYDPNRSGTLQTIKIDSTANTWSYPPSYSGSGRFFMVNPIPQYLEEQIRNPSAFRDDIERPATSKNQNLQGSIEVYPTAWASVDISSEAGMIGYSDSMTVNTIPDADFFLAATGYVSSPVYYELPPGTYSVELSDPPDSVLSLHVGREGPALTYARFDATPNQTDNLSVGEGIGVANHDPATKRIYFKTIFEFKDHERVMEIHRLALDEGDSTYVDTEEDGMLHLENHADAVTYDLILRRASADTLIRFQSVGVPIGAGARHRIPPDWDNLDTEPVEIEIDADGDGTYEGSMSVKNNVSIEDLGIRTDELPTRFALRQNYPNPFNPSTTIAYDVPSRSHVHLTVYDALGRAVATLVDEERAVGRHMITWDAGGASSGVYFYRLEAGTIVLTRSMFLAK